MNQNANPDAVRWERVQSLFLKAIERPPEGRADFIAELSGEDAELRHELTSLLKSHDSDGVMDLDAGRGRSEEELGRVARFTARIADRYRVVEEIGRGGMATVFLAEDVRHGRQVALKVLRAELASSLKDGHFLREIEISAKLRHPHILPLYDSGEAEGIPYFVTPYLPGASLRERLDRDGTLSVTEALRVARQVADALGYAHAQGVVHRDVKPGNILLEGKHAVVGDFGISRALDLAERPRLTKTGVTIGTPRYMSPEQISGGDADGRSDLYALGCVIFEMIAGQPPFRGETVVNLVKQHVFEDPPLLSELVPEIPTWVSLAVARALRKEPSERFQTADEMIEALEGEEVAAAAPFADTGRLKLAAILSADVEGRTRASGEDEPGAARSLQACRELIGVSVRRRGGRVVEAPGDSVLAEFTSVVQAVDAAVEIQRAIAERNAALSDTVPVRFRIGVDIGEVVVDGDRLQGMGVAPQLEDMAEPGGICVSADVQRQVDGKLALGFEDLGSRRLEDVSRPVQVFRVLLGPEGQRQRSEPRAELPEQEIRFCTAPDGVRLAYAIAGEGPTLVKSANWLNHLEYDWRSPIWAPFLHELVDDFQLIRYDERATGLSDWDADDISFDAFVQDLETVVDAAGLDRFPILGISQGCPVSIAYAVRHPERVTKLVLYGGYARGKSQRSDPGEAAKAEAVVTLMEQGWGEDNPAYRQIFTSRFIPEATPEQVRWFNELQRVTASSANAVRIRKVLNAINVEDLLPQVKVPTLVLHCRDDATVPFEEGRRIAARIEGARFVELVGKNHLIMEGERDWPRFLEEIKSFLLD